MPNPSPAQRSGHAFPDGASGVTGHFYEFDRGDEAAAVARLWKKCRLTLLSGESGAGKSHLARGAAALLDGRARFGTVTHRPLFPMAALPPRDRYAFPLLHSWFPERRPTELLDADPVAILAQSTADGRPVHLCVDQAELLFQPPRRHDDADRVRFLSALRRALSVLPNLRLLLVLRDSELEEAERFARELRKEGVPTDGHSVARLQADDVLERIGTDGRAFDPHAIAAGVIREMRTVRLADGHRLDPPAVHLGLFQTVYRRLSEEADAGNPVASTVDLTEQVDSALARHLTSTLNIVADDHKMSRFALARRFRVVFVDHLAAGPHGSADPTWTSALRAMEDRGLLKSVRDQTGVRYTLQHQKLLEAATVRAEGFSPLLRPTGASRLQEAATALWHGDHALAREHAESVERTQVMKKDSHAPDHPAAPVVLDGEPPDPVTGARALCLLGDLFYEQSRHLGADGDCAADPEEARRRTAEAVKCYERAAAVLEASAPGGESASVAYLLAAVGRLEGLEDHAKGLRRLHAAAARTPDEPFIQALLRDAVNPTRSPK